MRFALTVCLLLASAPILAQTTLVSSFDSHVLQQQRRIRIQLPDGYAEHPAQRYPLVLALDGEYMFYSVAAAAQVLNVSGAAPEVIIVAVDENYVDNSGDEARWSDGSYDGKTGVLRESGARFKSFLTQELVPYIERAYRCSGFRILAGHSFTATYVHFFLRDEQPLFQAYVSISPYLPRVMHEPIAAAAARPWDREMFYFASTGDEDLREHRQMLLELDATQLAQIHNPLFHYRFANYAAANHTTLVNRSMEPALRFIFARYAIVHGDEEQEAAFVADPLAYLRDKYAAIARLYGLQVSLRVDDLTAARRALTSAERWEQLRHLGEFTLNAFPASPEGDFMLGAYYEHTDRRKRAIAHEERGCAKYPTGSRSRRQCDQAVQQLRHPPARNAAAPATSADAPGCVQAGSRPQRYQPLRILFIGNSYTYFNNLPRLFEAIAERCRPGLDVRTDMVATGGATLSDSWNNGKAAGRIVTAPWDYVVLQEHSTLGPTHDEAAAGTEINDPTDFYHAVRQFDQLVRRQGARTVLLLTWPRADHAPLQTDLTRAYETAAAERNALLVRVGPAWQAAAAQAPAIDLYQADRSHPTPAGSYLAAALLYATLFHESPAGAPRTITGRPVDMEGAPLHAMSGGLGIRSSADATVLVDLAAADALQLQQVAAKVGLALPPRVHEQGGHGGRRQPVSLLQPSGPSLQYAVTVR